MELNKSFNQLIAKSIAANWDYDALTDYKGATLQYKDVARKIEKIHIVMEHAGIQKGDKIALCGRNSAHWGVTFLAILSYGAVAVPILHEFNAEQIHNIVNHSGSRLLFVGDVVAKCIDPIQMPELEGIVYLPDFSLLTSRSEQLTYAREHLNELFGMKYPKAFRKEHIQYHEDQEDELALINYTSGTTGFSKGVMLPYRAIMGNINFIYKFLAEPHMKPHCNMLCILPMAHMYGMAVEFLYPFSYGIHLFFLTRLPSPAIIAQAFSDVKPALVVAVPLIIEKIIRKKVFPKIQNNLVRLLLNMPVISKKVKQKICEQVYEAFGGQAYEIIIGGAAINQEVEAFLKSIDFPYTVGYGTTECAPLISYSDYHDYVPGSCGRAVTGMEVRILSSDPRNKEGEIVTRGQNVMLGYYKNEEATREAIDEEGWYHTGDLGTMDAYGNIFIRGRKKNMLLSANGQNVYPEEIEDKLNSMAMVSECVVIQRGEKFIALVYPDFEEAHNLGFGDEDITNVMNQNLQNLNAAIPAYSKVAAIEIRKEEFAKTPKKSIKRYLYQES
jgi:long-chain acyl-CoA synthetase